MRPVGVVAGHVGTADAEQRNYEQAIKTTEQGIALWGRDAALVSALAVAYGRAGKHDQARALLNELHGVARQRHIPPCWFAMIYMNLGEIDRAMEWLETAFQARDVSSCTSR